MMNQESVLRRTLRQIFVLVALAGLTFAAGVEWADAATPGGNTDSAVPGALHVVFLFLLTIGFVLHATTRTRKPTHSQAPATVPRARRR